MTTLDVSVVVATRNRSGGLRRTLDSVASQRLAALQVELIVVDDGSTNETAEILRAATSRLTVPMTVVRRERPGGPAAARDEGWRIATGSLVAFTDDDCRPAPDWIAAGAAAAQANPGAIIQGRTVPDPEHAERYGPFSRTIDVSAPDSAFQTCNIFYPRAVLERVGGFDTEAFGRAPGGEDADLAWRAIGGGAETVFAREAVVFHEVADLGPLGKLRFASRWTGPMRAYVRHPELRRAHFHDRLFWKRTHRLLAAAFLGGLIALLGRGRARLLGPLLAIRYARSLRARGKLEGGGLLLAPFYFLYDLVEMIAVARAAVRFRSPML